MRRSTLRYWLGFGSALTMTASLILVVPAAAAGTYSEQQGRHGANTFSNYHNASGMGPKIAAASWVEVSCKVYDPTISSAQPDGYWYRIASAPWNNQYYAVANTFMNGDPWGGPFTHNTDFNVPDCGSEPPAPAPQPPPQAASPTVTLTQGGAAVKGYWYSVSLKNFPAGASISMSCFDSVSRSAFRTFNLTVDGSGAASSHSQCYSGDGPDHWVLANNVESNHVSWSSSAVTPVPESPQPGPTQNTSTPAQSEPEKCQSFSGTQTPANNISDWLIGRFEGGYSSTVVIPWEYFAGNPQFVSRAKELRINEFVVGWRAVFPSDMYFALGRFTIKRTSEHCYTIYDKYDFDWPEIPFWLQQKVRSAVPFEVRSSGRL